MHPVNEILPHPFKIHFNIIGSETVSVNMNSTVHNVKLLLRSARLAADTEVKSVPCNSEPEVSIERVSVWFLKSQLILLSSPPAVGSFHFRLTSNVFPFKHLF
jgi:hypothetical protein